MRRPVALRFSALLVSLLSGCGGNSTTASTPATTMPPTPTLANLSATLSSPQDGTNIACTDPAFVTIVLTNTAHATVSISGIRRHQTSVVGNCTTVPDHTYPAIDPSIGTGSAAVLNHTQLFYPGSGCCSSFPCDDFCQVGFSFTVLTSLGEVNAGTITYGISFSNQCAACASASSLAAPSCPSRVQGAGAGMHL
ncbi:MAG TPA: hypothetical protein VMT70_21465 [Vicinamibacteria bacterium]|nr:hypothetical protein [Vicinamibacteria bacterium]